MQLKQDFTNINLHRRYFEINKSKLWELRLAFQMSEFQSSYLSFEYQCKRPMKKNERDDEQYF